MSGKKVVAGIWGIVGVAEWVAYFVDYRAPPEHPPLLYALSHLGKSAGYFLTLLGSALFWQQKHAYAALAASQPRVSRSARSASETVASTEF